MSRDNDEATVADFLKLARSILTLISFLILVVWSFFEFTVNPNRNVSYYLYPGSSYIVYGPTCDGQHHNVRISLESIEKSGRSYIGHARQGFLDTDEPEIPIEFKDKMEWVIFRCGETDVSIALVWEVQRDRVFLRVHQRMEIAEQPK